MTKELIDRVWKYYLPKEFKEEVKELYKHENKVLAPIDGVTTLNEIFGHHNLTSDAEGEDEMLYVNRKRVQEMFAEAQKAVPSCEYDRGFRGAELSILRNLFGSKSLPDEKDSATCQDKTCKNYDAVNGHCRFIEDCKYEPKPAEPKFNMGDIVTVVGIEKYDRIVSPILDRLYSNQGWFYEINMHTWIKEAWLEPYTESKYKVGEYAIMKGRKVEIIGYSDHHPEIYRVHVFTDNYQTDAKESDLEPYTEPKEESLQMKPIESKVSVYLTTKEEEEEFRMLLHENGFQWKSGTSLKGCSLWVNHAEEYKVLYVHPDKTVTYLGNKTPNTLTLSEFKKRYFGEGSSPNVNHSDIDIDEIVAKGYVPDPAKQFDTILKDSFSKERRLNIAAQVLCAIIPKYKDDGNGIGLSISNEKDMVKEAFRITDALIKEAEKGGN